MRYRLDKKSTAQIVPVGYPGVNRQFSFIVHPPCETTSTVPPSVHPAQAFTAEFMSRISKSPYTMARKDLHTMSDVVYTACESRPEDLYFIT